MRPREYNSGIPKELQDSLEFTVNIPNMRFSLQPERPSGCSRGKCAISVQFPGFHRNCTFSHAVGTERQERPFWPRPEQHLGNTTWINSFQDSLARAPIYSRKSTNLRPCQEYLTPEAQRFMKFVIFPISFTILPQPKILSEIDVRFRILPGPGQKINIIYVVGYVWVWVLTCVCALVLIFRFPSHLIYKYINNKKACHIVINIYASIQSSKRFIYSTTGSEIPPSLKPKPPGRLSLNGNEMNGNRI